MTSYKIALTGPAGSGKTTLAGALGKALSLPVLPEGVEDIYRKRAAFVYTQKTGAPAARQWEAVWASMDSHFEWCQVQAQRTADLPGFVADRWEMDIMSNWIRCFPKHDVDDRTKRLHDIWRARAGAYDLIVVLPIGDFPAGETNDLGMRRRMNMAVQLMAFSIDAGLATLIEPRHKVLQLGPDSSVEERVQSVFARLEDLSRAVVPSGG